MNRPEVLAALKAALNAESEPYGEAMRKHRDLTPDQADQARAMDLAEPVATVLAGQPEYRRYPNMMLQSGGGARTGFQPDRAAYMLVLRGMNDSADDAVNWLANLVEKLRAPGLHVMPVWQLTVQAAVKLTEDITLIPFSTLISSPQKSWLEAPIQHSFLGSLLPRSLGMRQPTAAITARKVVEPLFVDAAEEHRSDPDPIPGLLNDIRLCLSVVNPSPLIAPVQLFQFDDPDLNAVAGSAIGAVPLEIMPHWPPPIAALDEDAAQKLVPKFLALRGNTRDRVRISLQRLYQAMLRPEPGDKAADLSIALEALLTDQSGENTWKVSTRAGTLTGWDLQSKLDRRNLIVAAYRLRSSLVHSGTASNMTSVSGRGKMPAIDVCEEAGRICAAVIRAIIERGAIPLWPEFDVSGGAEGWPK
jgi:Apea-like HEPN